ncbi:hypothetical protein GXP70_17455 [Paenibacillus lycopersici]|uniref:DUF2140 family protein n=1 Tax=Paenibacillus lycopersici TaxID=2704462 RepID=A0A6C0FWW2_9BACL|nr:hypothetical protein [Paenibacillus lycopersici]QHT61578.1 hypothetical protein GXP70_17455 [Paenibacillus lycopersici]
MKKLIIVLGTLLLLIAVLGAAAAWYVKPAETLDLNYTPVPLEDRALDMARSLSTKLTLSEADVNNIGKAYIAANPQYGPNVTITGARFRFENGRVAGHYNLKVKNRVPVGIVVYYNVKWQDPNLIAEVDEAKLRSRTLPLKYFDDIVIPLGDSVPKPLRVQSASLTGNQLVITLKKPTLSELAQLLRRELGL